jgi:DNA/RNA endonuclease YhcR with UshA esterase domain
MRRNCLKQTIRVIAGLITSLLFANAVISLNARPLGSGAEFPAANAATKAESHPFYDITKEVTLSGPVTGVVHGPSAGLIPGSHILLVTGSGTVDASLGKWGLHGKTAPAIANGEQVTVRGVMKTIRNKEIFFVRTLVVGGHTYTIRNQHGVPFSPQSRERAEKTVQKGISL